MSLIKIKSNAVSVIRWMHKASMYPFVALKRRQKRSFYPLTILLPTFPSSPARSGELWLQGGVISGDLLIN